MTGDGMNMNNRENIIKNESKDSIKSKSKADYDCDDSHDHRDGHGDVWGHDNCFELLSRMC